MICYNGGKCISSQQVDAQGMTVTTEQCDCSTAFTANSRYAGSNCQYNATMLCKDPITNGGVGNVPFCVNGGTCIGTTGNCSCPSGWTGTHCETRVPTPANGGVQCGTTKCLNGGRCVQSQVMDKNGTYSTQYFCDCYNAFNDKYLYAGTSCQYQSTSLCTVPSSGSLKGAIFCTNNGVCNPDNVYSGCQCPDAFTGLSCEFEVSQETGFNATAAIIADDHPATQDQCGDVACHNGGTCVTTTITTPGGGIQQVQHCDCSTAVTATTAFAGDSCQHEATAFCTKPANLSEAIFCVNGGTCDPNVLEGCDCPTGWTGFRCEYPEPTQDILGNDTAPFGNILYDGIPCGYDNYCFNGGVCTTSTHLVGGQVVTAHLCDCSNAFTNTTLYAGSSCQFASTTLCTQPAPGATLAGQQFCVNQGTCKQSVADGCNCPEGWNGTHCEVPVNVTVNASNDATVHACGNITCLHGGTCVSTQVVLADGTVKSEAHCDCSTAYTSTDLYAGETCEFKSTSLCTQPEAGASLEGTQFCVNGGICRENVNQGCECPPGWTGFRCEFEMQADDFADQAKNDTKVTQCGDLVCLNGGTCVTSLLTSPDGGTREEQHCDCSTAVTSTDLYAGEQCEFKSTTFCTQPKSNSTLAGVLFCVNGGHCQANVLQGCSCPSAWTGFHCEYSVETDDNVDPADGTPQVVDNYVPCGDTHCFHGGACINATVNGAQENFCDCSTAGSNGEKYAGALCQYKATANCSDGILFCVNGGQCRPNPKNGCACPSGYRGFQCEISLYQGQDPEDNIVAGNATENNPTNFDAATDVCTLGDPRPGLPFYFCLNNGICVDKVTADMPPPGCNCTTGWSGNHCEIRTGSSSSSSPPSSTSSSSSAAASTTPPPSTRTGRQKLFIVLGALLLVLAIFVCIRCIRRNPEEDSDASRNCMYFRRRRHRQNRYRDDEQVNLAPRAPQDSFVMGNSELSSSTQPMIAGLTLAPDDEPGLFRDDPTSGHYHDEFSPYEPDDEPRIFIGPPRDEDGHELHNVDII